MSDTEMREKIGRILYECEAKRAAHVDTMLSAARGKAIPPTMEPWEECQDAFLSDADALLPLITAAKADGARGATEWQPIETAPRDGTPVLLGITGNEYYPRSGWWDDDFESWIIRRKGLEATGLGIKPTHWRPLPLPPQKGGA